MVPRVELHRGEAHPGRHLAVVLEVVSAADAGQKRAGADRANARAFHDKLNEIKRARLELNSHSRKQSKRGHPLAGPCQVCKRNSRANSAIGIGMSVARSAADCLGAGSRAGCVFAARRSAPLTPRRDRTLDHGCGRSSSARSHDDPCDGRLSQCLKLSHCSI